MLDSQKVEYLFREAKVFDNDITSERLLRDKIKFTCLKYLDEHYKCQIASELSSFKQYGSDSSITDLITNNAYLETLSEVITIVNNLRYKKLKKDIEQNLFINNYSNKFSIASIIYVKEAIAELAKIDISILEIHDEKTFKLYFKEKESYIEVPKIFKDFKLIKHLKNNEGHNERLGLYDFEHNLELPDIIDSKFLINKKLTDILFIEGLSGAGKSVLAQNIGFNISKLNSYYIDLEKHLQNFDIEYERQNVNLLFNSLKKEGIVILDNIQSSEVLTRDFLEIAHELNFKNIIIVAQYDLKSNSNETKRFSEKFLSLHYSNPVQNTIKILEISNSQETIDIRLSLIRNLLKYCIKTDLISSEPKEYQIDKLENNFQSAILYLKMAIEFSGNLDDLSINIAKESILEKYSVFFNDKSLYGFKIFFCLYCIHGRFIFKKEIYKERFNDEQVFLKRLVEKKMIFKYIENDNIAIEFPHRLIPHILFDKFLLDEKEVNKIDFDFLYSMFDKSQKYFYLINKNFFDLIPIEIANEVTEGNFFRHIIKLLVKNNYQFSDTISFKLINQMMFKNEDIEFIFEIKEEILNKRILFEKEESFDYNKKILDILKGESTNLFFAKYEIFIFLTRALYVRKFELINYVIKLFCESYIFNEETIDIAIFIKSNSKKFRIEKGYISILNKIIFSNKKNLIQYFMNNTEYKIIQVLQQGDKELVEFINNNLELILEDYNSSFKSLLLLFLISNDKNEYIKCKQQIKEIIKLITYKDIEKYLQSLSLNQLYILIIKLLTINDITQHLRVKANVSIIIDFVISYLCKDSNLEHMSKLLTKFIFTETKEFITFYTFIKNSNQIYRTYIEELINHKIQVPSNFLNNYDIYEIMNLNSLNGLHNKVLFCIGQKDDLFSYSEYINLNMVFKAIEYFFIQNNKLYYKIFNQYYNYISYQIGAFQNNDNTEHINYDLYNFVSLLYKFNYVENIDLNFYSTKIFKERLFKCSSEVDNLNFKNFILFLSKLKDDNQINNFLIQYNEKLIDYYFKNTNNNEDNENNNILDNDTLEFEYHHRKIDILFNELVINENYTYTEVTSITIFITILKYLNIMDDIKKEKILTSVIKYNQLKSMLKGNEQFFLYYILDLLEYKKFKYKKYKKIYKMLHSYFTGFLIEANTIDNILLKTIALKGLIIVSKNKQLTFELKEHKGIKQLISDYQDFKKKQLLTEFDIHICDNILQNLQNL